MIGAGDAPGFRVNTIGSSRIDNPDPVNVKPAGGSLAVVKFCNSVWYVMLGRPFVSIPVTDMKGM